MMMDFFEYCNLTEKPMIFYVTCSVKLSTVQWGGIFPFPAFFRHFRGFLDSSKCCRFWDLFLKFFIVKNSLMRLQRRSGVNGHFRCEWHCNRTSVSVMRQITQISASGNVWPVTRKRQRMPATMTRSVWQCSACHWGWGCFLVFWGQHGPIGRPIWGRGWVTPLRWYL